MLSDKQAEIIERIGAQNEELNRRAIDASNLIEDVERALLERGVAIEFWCGNIGLSKCGAKWRLCTNLPDKRPLLSASRENRIYITDVLLDDFLLKLENVFHVILSGSDKHPLSQRIEIGRKEENES